MSAEVMYLIRALDFFNCATLFALMVGHENSGIYADVSAKSDWQAARESAQGINYVTYFFA